MTNRLGAGSYGTDTGDLSREKENATAATGRAQARILDVRPAGRESCRGANAARHDGWRPQHGRSPTNRHRRPPFARPPTPPRPPRPPPCFAFGPCRLPKTAGASRVHERAKKCLARNCRESRGKTSRIDVESAKAICYLPDHRRTAECPPVSCRGLARPSLAIEGRDTPCVAECVAKRGL
jgi:hypothetical protein